MYGEEKCPQGGILCRGVVLNDRAAVFEEAVVGDESVIEEGSVVKPRVKIWPEKRLESGSVLKENLVWGTNGGQNLFGINGVRGELYRDIFPDTALRLGAAYGSSLKGGRVVVSHDGYPPSLMIARSIATGFLSTGVEVLDAGESITPVMRRYISKHQDVRGGIQVNLTHNNPFMITIRFFDEKGLNVGRNKERTIEQLYYRDDFSRAPAAETGIIIQEKLSREAYSEDLLSGIQGVKSGTQAGTQADIQTAIKAGRQVGAQVRAGIQTGIQADRETGIQIEAIRKAGFRVVLGYPSPVIDEFMKNLSIKLNCRLLTLNMSASPMADGYLNISKLREKRYEIAGAVRNHHAALGIMIDPAAEEMLLFDERGNLVEGERARALHYLLMFRHNSADSLRKAPVPVNSSGVVSELARRYGREVEYIRTNDVNKDDDGNNSNNDWPDLPGTDIFVTLTRLLEFMALQESSFSTVLSEIPPINLCRKEAFCSWHKKGRIMRKLIEETTGDDVEMIDGLKVYHPHGWALVLPDPEKPSYHVYGEGYNEEISASLTDLYVKKIDSLKVECD